MVICDSSAYCIHADWLAYLTNLEYLDHYDWVGASHTWLIYGLDNVVKLGCRSYVGLYLLLTYWIMEHITRGHSFGRLHDELLPLPRQWVEPDHWDAAGVYSYESYRYLLDLAEFEDVHLRPFSRYDGFNWAPLNSGRVLRDKQVKFYYMKKLAYFLLGRVRHRFLNEFCIPVSPPFDMDLPVSSRATARSRHVAAMASQDSHVLREVNCTDYLTWYWWVEKPYLFKEVVRDSQRRMWYASDWAKGFKEQFASFYEDIQ